VKPSQLPPVAAKIAVAVLISVAVASGAIWWRSEDAEPVVTRKPADPLSSRRGGLPIEPAPGGPIHGGVIPPDPDFHLPEGFSLSTGSGTDAAALQGHRAKLENNPQDFAALYESGRTLLRMGQHREATAPLRQAMELQPADPAPAFFYGYANARAQRWAEAVTAFQRVKSAQPNEPKIAYDLALALQRLNDYSRAVQEYQNALHLDATFVPARLGLAISLDRLGRSEEAVAAYRQALSGLSPGIEADRVQARISHLGG
jgi:Flp pilus assembly protein TadD